MNEKEQLIKEYSDIHSKQLCSCAALFGMISII